jgi:Transposase IS116/IS110/IS902 family
MKLSWLLERAVGEPTENVGTAVARLATEALDAALEDDDPAADTEAINRAGGCHRARRSENDAGRANDCVQPDGPRELLGGDSSPQPLRFPTSGHLLWAGLCPRLHESAAKRFSTRTRPRMPWLKTAFVQAAWAAGRKRNTYIAELPLLGPSIRGDSGAR